MLCLDVHVAETLVERARLVTERVEVRVQASALAPRVFERLAGDLQQQPLPVSFVSQLLLAVLDYVHAPSVDLAAIVSAPRYHHQWWPDEVEVEPEGFPTQWRAALEAKGHRVEISRRQWGNMQAVFKAKAGGIAQAASDPRGSDVGY